MSDHFTTEAKLLYSNSCICCEDHSIYTEILSFFSLSRQLLKVIMCSVYMCVLPKQKHEMKKAADLANAETTTRAATSLMKSVRTMRAP